MIETRAGTPPQGAFPQWLRALTVAEMLCIVLPVAALAGLGVVFGIMEGTLLGAAAIAQLLLALAALAATAWAGIVAVRRGVDALAALSPWVFRLMHAGAALVMVGVAAIALGPVVPLGLGESVIAANVLGAPALIPYLLLLRLRRRGATPDGASRAMSPREWLVGATPALAIALLALLVLGPEPLDTAAWMRSDETSRDFFLHRQRMAAWLVASHELEGLSRSELVARLGPPDQENAMDGDDLLYAVGGEPFGFGIVFLVVEPGDDGRVRNVYIARD